MSDMKLTRLIRLMFQSHKIRRKNYSKFPSQEWVLAQYRLLEMQKRLHEKNSKTKGDITSDS